MEDGAIGDVAAGPLCARRFCTVERKALIVEPEDFDAQKATTS